MPMSRRFFTKLAANYVAQKPAVTDYDDPAVYSASLTKWVDMVLATSSAMQEEAPSFNRERFLLAAGIPAEAAATL